MRIFIGVPAYDGKVGVATVQSLLAETAILEELGHECGVGFVTGCSLITHARNDLARGFLASGFDKLAMIDADVSWEAGALVRLLHHTVDLVGGAYPYKRHPESYPVTWLASKERAGGLIEVEGLPGGFMVIARSALDRIIEAFPDRKYRHGDDLFYAFFDAAFRDGRLFGEDNAFCDLFRKAGGKVWLDPDLTLTHTGGDPAFTGRIGDWLACEAAMSIAAE